jgi:hypothetical protein
VYVPVQILQAIARDRPIVADEFDDRTDLTLGGRPDVKVPDLAERTSHTW